MTGTPSIQALQATLRALQAQIAAAEAGPDELALLHRDAAYAALDVGDTAAAMTHALACLDLARAVNEPSLKAKAHVVLALVQAEVYDDLGAAQHFTQADALVREAGDDRGVALVAVNAAHYEMERAQSLAAVTRLQALLDSPQVRGVDLGPTQDLKQALHINYLVSAAGAHLGGEVLPGAVRRQVEASQALLESWLTNRQQLGQPLRVLEILEALTLVALMDGQQERAAALADERVRLAVQADGPLLVGRALLDRVRVHEAAGAWAAVEADARQAVLSFTAAGHELFATRARERLAEALSHQGQFQAAFNVQREATRQVYALYHGFYQQRALVGQIEQQARDAEVRAAAFAEAALRDPLTGAPNRAHAMQVLAGLHAQARQGRGSAVALMDLDHFKRVNDTYGHAAGDAVLTRVVQVLGAEVRGMDCVARFGGEEFIIILPGVSLSGAEQVCQRLSQVLADLEWPDIDPALRVTGSFGVAWLHDGATLTDTLREADVALYEAKAAGRHTVRVLVP
ncbi:sensor domain-containing diguanylate cyclase [Deinococcus navajonensis]|uniref:Diguanylate cyclase n=1 Tax=Deinococcus navajonensis TaxID=309884 RepID=A0ABV8XQY8_9DEIO